jgi:general secretion pathway protein L
MFSVDHMLDWQARIDSGLRTALRWWLDELVGIVPEEWRRRIAGLRSRLLLVIDDHGAYLATENGDRRETLGRVDVQAGQAESVRRLLADVPQAGRSATPDVVVCLPAGRALRTSVTLPLAAERNLEAVVGFEFERLVPFKRDEVYYAYEIASRNKAARNLTVGLTVIPRVEVEELLRLAQRLDIHVAGLEIAGEKPPFTASPILLHDRHRPATHPRARIAIIGLTVIAACLVIAGIAIPFFQANRTLDQLSAQVADAKRAAEASLNLQKQIDAEIQDQQALITKRRQSPTVTELLDIVTKLTPDDTWLTELQLTGNEIHLIGASASATALLGLVDQSPNFRNAAFRSSITQDSKIERERFDIAAKVAPREGP